MAEILQKFENRCAFITGGASGIGLGMAEAFIARGLSVVLADIDGTAAEAQADRLRKDGGKVCAVPLDIRDAAAWEAALDTAEAAVGPLAILCANAGVAGNIQPLIDTSIDGWRWTMEVNLDGCFQAIRAGLPRLLAHGRPAHFVATSSMGAFSPIPTNGVYSAAKAAVITLCETLREELSGRGVGISVLCPGLVNTGILAHNAHLAPPGVEVGVHADWVQTGMKAAISPRIVGELVAKAIDANRFWIFTAPETREHLMSRMRELDEAASVAEQSGLLGRIDRPLGGES